MAEVAVVDRVSFGMRYSLSIVLEIRSKVKVRLSETR